MPTDQRTEPADASEPPEAPPGWYEYSLGPYGLMLQALRASAIPVGVGAGIAFGLVLVLGLLGEEAVFDSSAINEGLDQFARLMLGVLCAVAAAAALLACLCGGLLPWVAARRLRHEVRTGAVRTAVPTPAQQDLLLVPIAKGLKGLLVGFICLDALALLIFIPASFASGFDTVSLQVLGVTLAIGAALFGGVRLIDTRLRPAHGNVANGLRSFWRPAEVGGVHRRIRIQSEGTPTGGAPVRPVAPGWYRLCTGGQRLGAVGVQAGFALLMLAVYIRQPGRYADRREFGPSMEQGIDLLALSAAIVGGIATAMLVITALTRALIRATERRRLHESAADPQSARPETALLQRHSHSGTVLAAQLLSGAGGVGLIVAITARIDAGREGSLFAGAEAILGPMLAGSLLAIILGCVCQALEIGFGRASRNRILLRWPTRRAKDEDEDDE
ncbi:hypothetical protein [Ruania zhangjianzhongii]|uniref:hypothetical protein n=1 Tax=Ruania zhangjianzhongii TaxID=2603206 RepID=UPI0011C9B6AD|nr:hypothetical protein [Ruania zhangjianzhongii]